ncbi:MAG: tandem-95 repeat protein, partial [Pirellulaceae bacterium]|nr:tandem-95 repeat protein [Pirellulaceae bacterium]
MLLENLEVRNLLTGPQIIGVQPNDGELFRLDDPNALGDHDIRNVAPQDITFHFDEAQRIDLRTVHEGLQDGITDGIQITRANADGGFGEAATETDFGTGFDPADPEQAGSVNIVFKAVRLGEEQNGVTLDFSTRDQGGAGYPTVILDGTKVSINLNVNEGNHTTARDLAEAIANSEASSLVSVEIEGDAGADITGDLGNHTPQVLQGANDIVVSAGFIGYGDSENEVIFRFGEGLPDDLYRIHIFNHGDDALLNKNGETFVNLDDDGEARVTPFQLDFELDLGAFVKAIVPQPVVRTLAKEPDENDTLVQARDQIIVYFNDDDLCTRTAPDGPCAGTDEPAQQAEFYQLIYTNDSVNNLDDAKFIPETVSYNPDTDSALLTFAAPLDELRRRTLVRANPSQNEFSSQHHGLKDGDFVRFESNDTLPSGLLSGIDYHVINRTAESFQVSLVENGTAVTLTNAGSGVHEVTTEVGAGTFRLRIGTDEFAPEDFSAGSRPPEPLHTDLVIEPGSSFATATGIGLSFEVTATDSGAFSDGSTLSLTNDASPAVVAEYTFDRDATRQSILDNPQTVNLGDFVTLEIPHDAVTGGADVADGQAFTLLDGDPNTAGSESQRFVLAKSETVSAGDVIVDVSDMLTVSLPAGGGFLVQDNESFKIEFGDNDIVVGNPVKEVIFELDRNNSGSSIPGSRPILFSSADSQDALALKIVQEIEQAILNGDLPDVDPTYELGSGTIVLERSTFRNRLDTTDSVSLGDGTQVRTAPAVAELIVEAIQGTDLRLAPLNEQGGLISLGGSTADTDYLNDSLSPTNFVEGSRVLSQAEVIDVIADKINESGFGIQAAATGSHIALTGVVDGNFQNASATSVDPMEARFTDSMVLTSEISPSSVPSEIYDLLLPGGNNEPGHRETRFFNEKHIPDDVADSQAGITTFRYNFRSDLGVIGTDPAFNTITEIQKLRAREVFEILNQATGIQFLETAEDGFVIAMGDVGAISLSNTLSNTNDLWFVNNERDAAGEIMARTGFFDEGTLGTVLNNGNSWDDSFGGSWMQALLEQVGHLLGLGHANDLPGSVMHDDTVLDAGEGAPFFDSATPEPIFPGDHDILHLNHLYRPDSKDIDMFRVELPESGQLTLETIAERHRDQNNPDDLLDSVIKVYQVRVEMDLESGDPLHDENGNLIPVLDSNGEQVKDLIASNDDYFSDDSFLSLNLRRGIYFVGVSASGNNSYDPVIEDSGFGGTSQGKYDLRLTFRSDSQTATAITDVDNPVDEQNPEVRPTRLDGDADGVPGGVYNQWFRVARPLEEGESRSAEDAPKTLFVDKTAQPWGDGSLARPFNNIQAALSAAQIGMHEPLRHLDPSNNLRYEHVGDIIRVLNNPGRDGDIRTETDNRAYEIGFPQLGSPLQDGSTLEIPRGVTMMVDAGAIFKFRRADIHTGSSSPMPERDRSAGALQVFGAPLFVDPVGNTLPDDFIAATSLSNLANDGPEAAVVHFTSYDDESLGLDTFPFTTTPQAGDWGGLVFQADIDNADATRFHFEEQGIFLNYVNHAEIRYGGGNVTVESLPQAVAPIQIIDSRPTITFNTVSLSSDAAMSATPDSFLETTFHAPKYQDIAFTADYGRVGPEIHRNALSNNAVNGLMIKIETPAGNELRELTVAGRWDDHDIVHYLPENLVISGTPGGPFLELEQPSLALVTGTSRQVNSTPQRPLMAGEQYNYRLVFVDAAGNESRPSDASRTFTVGDLNGDGLVDNSHHNAIELRQLLTTSGDFVGRRLYRSEPGGDGEYTLVALLSQADDVYLDDGTTRGGQLADVDFRLRPRLDGRLAIDPQVVTKAFGSYIEVGVGAQLLMEAADGREAIITTITDDRYGAGGTFDTGNDGTPLPIDTANPSADLGLNAPRPGSWGGIHAKPGSHVSIDHAVIAFGGGVTRIEGTFTGFNVLELMQAEARVANSIFEFNANGFGGQAPPERFGRGFNEEAVIFVRAAQPVLVGNAIRHNKDLDPNTQIAAISINTNALNYEHVTDPGRSIGRIDRVAGFRDNQGPLIHGNQLSNNEINGMTVRGEVLTTQSVWDDTDTVHVLFDEVIVPDVHVFGGLRLESTATQSLVVKMGDPQAGFQATGRPLDVNDRIGGLIQIVGQPKSPVVLTSLADDSHGAGRQPNGDPQVDTNNDLAASAPSPGDWNSVIFDRFSHDRNIEVVTEASAREDNPPGPNGTAARAHFLGGLAPREQAADDNVRLGFSVHGFLSATSDRDVYSFSAVAGTETWVDLDRTTHAFDPIIELIDSHDNVLARSTNSADESDSPTGFGQRWEVDDRGAVLFDDTTGQPHAIVLEEVVSGLVERSLTFEFDSNGNGVEVKNGLHETLVIPFSLADDATTLAEKIVTTINRSESPLITALNVSAIYDGRDRFRVFFNREVVPTAPTGLLDHGSLLFEDVTVRGAVYKMQKTPPFEGQDFYSTNPRDAGMRVVLPGPVGTTNVYHVRVRSNGPNLDNIAGGLTSGGYELGIRLREVDEIAGSSVKFANIAFATNGISVLGQPGHSPLVGETSEVDDFANDAFGGAQFIGNIVAVDRNATSIAGELDAGLTTDVDYYQFTVDGVALNNRNVTTYPVVFDLDYNNGLARGDAGLWLYNSAGVLIASSLDSSIADDRPDPIHGAALDLLDRGSVGGGDPFLGPIELIPDTYTIAVSAGAGSPVQLANALTRVEPNTALLRIAEDRIGTGSLVDAQSLIPWHLGDVGLYVLREAGAGTNSAMHLVDPFTGEPVVSSYNAIPWDVEDFAFRSDASLFGYSTGLDASWNPPTDGNRDAAGAGYFLEFDTGTGSPTNHGWYGGSAGIETFGLDVNDEVIGVHQIAPDDYVGYGIHFSALEFGFPEGPGFGGQVETLLGIGHRGDYFLDPALRSNGVEVFENILFYMNPYDVDAVSPAGSVVASDEPEDQIGQGLTDAEAVGRILTAAELDVPDATIFDSQITKNTLFNIEDGDTILIDDGFTQTTFEFDFGPQVRQDIDVVNNSRTIRDDYFFVLDADEAVSGDERIYQFDTGPALHFTPLPASLSGFLDGTRVRVQATPTVFTTFEFVDRTLVDDAEGSPNTVDIYFVQTDDGATLAGALVNTINAVLGGFVSAGMSGSRVTLGGELSVSLISHAPSSLQIEGSVGIAPVLEIVDPALISDGDQFTVATAAGSQTFEFDDTLGSSPGTAGNTIAIPFNALETAEQIATTVAFEVLQSQSVNGLNLTSQLGGPRVAINGPGINQAAGPPLVLNFVQNPGALAIPPVVSIPSEEVYPGAVAANQDLNDLTVDFIGRSVEAGVNQDGRFVASHRKNPEGTVGLVNTSNHGEFSYDRISFLGAEVGDFRGMQATTTWPIQSAANRPWIDQQTRGGLVNSGHVGIELLAADEAADYTFDQFNLLATFPQFASAQLQFGTVQADPQPGVATKIYDAVSASVVTGNPDVSLLQVGSSIKLSGAVPVVSAPFNTAGEGPGGLLTGMVIMEDSGLLQRNNGGGQIFAVSDAGGLYAFDIRYTGVEAGSPGLWAVGDVDYIESSAADLLGIQFQGLTHGPPDVEGGRYRDLLFAVDDAGRVYAFDTSGVLQPIFVDGQTSVATGLTDVRGLEFGTLDQNLFHQTPTVPVPAVTDFMDERFLGVAEGSSFVLNERQVGTVGGGLSEDDGHGAPGTEGSSSIHFGRGLWQYPDPDLVRPHTGAILGARGYDFPGGAHGSLVTNEFSLVGYRSTDQPTLSFTYFSATDGSAAYDSFRVFVSDNDGDWELLASNHGVGQELFDNTGAWRQVRIPLDNFAGVDHLRLRFDFSTAGDMNLGDTGNTGQELRAVAGIYLRDGDRFQIDGERFEFESGYTIVPTSGGPIQDGERLKIEDPFGKQMVFEFDKDGTFTQSMQLLSGDQFTDGQQLLISDGVHAQTFEFDAGLRLHMPDFLSLRIPANAFIQDGETFTISDGAQELTFEFESLSTANPNGLSDPAHVAIPFFASDSQDALAERIIAAIEQFPWLDLTPTNLDGGVIQLGAGAKHVLDTRFTNLEQFGEALRIEEGDHVRIQQATTATAALPDVIFEFDQDGLGQVAGNPTTRIVRMVDMSNDFQIQLMDPPTGLNGLRDLEEFIIFDGTFNAGVLQGHTFEFDSNGTTIAAPNRSVVNIADLRTLEILGPAGLPPQVVDGNFFSIDDGSGPVDFEFDNDGVVTGEPIDTAENIVLQVPGLGGVAIDDDEMFALSDGSNTVIFEFDQDNSGVTAGERVVKYRADDTQEEVADKLAAVINEAVSQGVLARFVAVHQGAGVVELVNTSQGDSIDITNADSLTSGTTPKLQDELAARMVTAINAIFQTGPDNPLEAAYDGNGVIALKNSTDLTVVNPVGAPGIANRFRTMTQDEVAEVITREINAAGLFALNATFVPGTGRILVENTGRVIQQGVQVGINVTSTPDANFSILERGLTPSIIADRLVVALHASLDAGELQNLTGQTLSPPDRPLHLGEGQIHLGGDDGSIAQHVVDTSASPLRVTGNVGLTRATDAAGVDVIAIPFIPDATFTAADVAAQVADAIGTSSVLDLISLNPRVDAQDASVVRLDGLNSFIDALSSGLQSADVISIPVNDRLTSGDIAQLLEVAIVNSSLNGITTHLQAERLNLTAGSLGSQFNEIEPNNPPIDPLDPLTSASQPFANPFARNDLQNLDALQFSLNFDSDIGDSTFNTSQAIPHVTINGTGDGTVDAYLFHVNQANDVGIFDIDGTSTTQPVALDTELFVYPLDDVGGGLVALGSLVPGGANDVGPTTAGAGGSVDVADAFLEVTFDNPGDYVVVVAKWDSDGEATPATFNPLDPGDQYTLHVSLTSKDPGLTGAFNVDFSETASLAMNSEGTVGLNDRTHFPDATLVPIHEGMTRVEVADQINAILEPHFYTPRIVAVAPLAPSDPQLAAPAIAQIQDGDTFQLSDGVNVVTFEFNSGYLLDTDPAGGAAITHGDAFTITDDDGTGGSSVTFEFVDQSLSTTPTIPGAIPILFLPTNPQVFITQAVVAALNAAASDPVTSLPATLLGLQANLISSQQVQIEVNPDVFLTGDTTAPFDPAALLPSGLSLVAESDPTFAAGNVVIPFRPSAAFRARHVADAIEEAINNGVPAQNLPLDIIATVQGNFQQRRVELTHTSAPNTDIQFDPGTSSLFLELPMGDTNNDIVKQHQDLIRIIGHTVVDAGQLGFDANLPLDQLPPDGFNHPFRGENNFHEGVYIDDIIIGFAERGQEMHSDVVNTDTGFTTVIATDFDHGEYQLEIRRGPSVSTPRSVHTNDRFTEALTIVAQSGARLADGETFALSDGVNSLTFEYDDLNSTNGVRPGNVRVAFDPAMPDWQVARHIRDAINSGPVQAALDIAAALSDGSNGGNIPDLNDPDPRPDLRNGPLTSDNRVNIFGPIHLLPDTHVSRPVHEGNETLATAVDTEIVSFYSVPFHTSGAIGDNPNLLLEPGRDVDLFYVTLNQGDVVRIDLDAEEIGSPLDAFLRVFDEDGNPIRDVFGNEVFSNNAAAAGEAATLDPFLEFEALLPGMNRYYIGVSGAPTIPTLPTDEASPFVPGGYLPAASLPFVGGDNFAPAQFPFWRLPWVQPTLAVAAPFNELYDPTVAGEGIVGSTGFYELDITFGSSTQADFILFDEEGDSNRFRDQGQLIVSSNLIENASEFGILVDAGQRDAVSNNPHPGSVRHLDEINVPNLIPSATIVNNRIIDSGIGGIQFSGDPNLTGMPVASQPFGRILNNTIVGNAVDELTRTETVTLELLANSAATTETDIFVVDLSTLPNGLLHKLTLSDDNNFAEDGSGLPGEYSGLNLDAIKISDTLVTDAALVNALPALEVQLLGQQTPTLVPALDFSDSGTLLQAGTQNPPVDLQLFGTLNGEIRHDIATLDQFDATIPPNQTGFVSLGDGGSITFNLASPISTTVPRYLYVGEVRENGGAGPDFLELQVSGELDAAPAGIGIDVVNNASPTILNNIFSLLETGVSVDASSASTTLGGAGTVLAGSVYHRTNTRRSGVPIEDFAIPRDFEPILPGQQEPVLVDQLFVGRTTGNYYLAPNTRAIDSGIASLEDRFGLSIVREPMGIAPSPILAPAFDGVGQLRIGNPDNQSPFGSGANVVVDRGAIDTSDHIGPTAFAIKPFDNDADLIDANRHETVISVPANAALSSFEIRLVDGVAPLDAGEGIGLDDATVTSDKIAVYQNGFLLVDNVDYSFSFDATSNTVRLTPLSGIWTPDRVYTIQLSNDVTYTMTAKPGAEIIDGQNFLVRDKLGHETIFEFEQGYRLDVPQTLQMVIPVGADGVVNAINDGDQFTISDSLQLPLTFEFDRDGSVDPNVEVIDFETNMSADEVAQRVVNALNDPALDRGLAPKALPGGRVHLGTKRNHFVNITSFSSLSLDGQTQGVEQGDIFAIDDGTKLVTFEFNDANIVAEASIENFPIFFTQGETHEELANIVVASIRDADLGLNPRHLGAGQIHLDSGVNHVLDVTLSQLASFGTPGTSPAFGLKIPSVAGQISGLLDGETFSIRDGLRPAVQFELNNTDEDPNTGFATLAINFNEATTVDELAETLVVAIQGAGLGLNPEHVPGTPIVTLGGNAGHALSGAVEPNVLATTNLVKMGSPGVAAAVPVPISRVAEFDANQVAVAMIQAINNPVETHSLVGVNAASKGGATVVVTGADDDAVLRAGVQDLFAISTGSPVFVSLDSAAPLETVLFTESIRDLAGNPLKPNQLSGETQITIFLGDVATDMGDAPEGPTPPFVPPQNIYPTLLGSNGAVHVVTPEGLFLGALLDTEPEGQPELDAAGDGADEDGVRFAGPLGGQFNAHIPTSVEVTASGSGYLDGWIDFNRDGDWDDAGEQVFASEAIFVTDPDVLAGIAVGPQNENCHQDATSQLIVCSLAVDSRLVPEVVTGPTYARFRLSSEGGLKATGLASDGETEDYTLDILPGTPPTAVDDPAVDADPADFQTEEDFAILFQTRPSLYTNDFDMDAGDTFGIASLQGLRVVDPMLPNVLVATSDKGAQVKVDTSLSVGAMPNQIGGSWFYDPSVSSQLAELAVGDSGLDTFQYTLRDLDGFESPVAATVTIEVLGLNDPPVANAVSVEVFEDGAVIASVDFDGDDPDRDDDGSTLTYLDGTIPASLRDNYVNNKDGTFGFDPGEDFQQLAQGETTELMLSYEVEDSHGQSSLVDGIVTVIVNGTNDHPVAHNLRLDVEEDGGPETMAFQGSDVDSDDDQSTLSYFIDPDGLSPGEANGSVVNNDDGTFTFDPGTDFQDLGIGQSRNVFLAYTAIDQHGAMSLLPGGLITIVVSGTNDNPTAIANDDYRVGEDALLEGDVITDFDQPLGADFDVDFGDTYTVNAVGFTNSGPGLNGFNVGVPLTTPANAMLELNGDGTFTYDPRGSDFEDLSPGDIGTETFFYSIRDWAGSSSLPAMVTITVEGRNEQPIGIGDMYAVNEGSTLVVGDTLCTTDPAGMNNNSVLCNDSDPEGDAIEALPISIPQFAASFEFDTTDGTFVYEHDGSEATTDSFIYRVRDEGGGLSSAVTVTINVIPENDPPIANDDEFTVDRGGRLVIEPADLLANDFDAEGNLEAPIPVVYPANGNFQELADGSFEYVHDGSSFEPDSFTYIVSDGATQSNEATVSINITLPPPSPGQNP